MLFIEKLVFGLRSAKFDHDKKSANLLLSCKLYFSFSTEHVLHPQLFMQEHVKYV